MKLRVIVCSTGLLCGLAFGASSDAVKVLETAPLRFEPSGAEPGRFIARGARYAFEFATTQVNFEAGGRRGSLRFIGADPRARLAGQQLLNSRTNLFLGNDPEKWRRGVANFGRLSVEGIYRGIDLVYYGNGGDLEYDFKVAPGANPGQLRFRLDGAKPSIDSDGNLIADLIQKRPVAYQIAASGDKLPVESRYRRNRDGSYGFALGKYDHARELVIDPVLTFSLYINGSGRDIAYAVSHDRIGFIYVAGTTTSSDFPLAGTPTQSTAGGSGDIFVAKIDPHAAAGSQVIFSTYLGGSSTESFGGFVVGPNGDIYITGTTQSTNFPVTTGALQTTQKITPNVDAFVSWIDANQTLVYSTYLGGSNPDTGNAIALDSKGHVWVTGGTLSDDFPNVSGIQAGRVGSQDMFITGLDLNQTGGNAVLYSSYLGGTYSDIGLSMLIAGDGTLWIAGATFSYDAPVPGGYHLSYRGGGDVYIVHVDPNRGSNGLLYGTFLGGTGQDQANSIALDASGRVVVSGFTLSSDFPVSSGALQPTYGGDTDAFVSILNTANDRDAQLIYSTYFGGANGDDVFGMKVDSSGAIYLAGMTMSPGLPATADAFQSEYDGTMDAFILRVNPAQSGAAGIGFFSYLGSDGLQTAYGLDFDGVGNLWVVGSASGPIFDHIGGVGKPSGPGDTDVFVMAFPIGGSSISHVSDEFPESGGSSTVAITARATTSSWTASSSLDWITVFPAQGMGDGSVTIAVAPNTTGVARQGKIEIAGQSFEVDQRGFIPRSRH